MHDRSANTERLARAVKGARRILITGPSSPDGDSIGASLALAEVFRRSNPAVEVVVASEEPIPPRYAFLSGVRDVVGADQLDGAFDVAVVLDGVRHRIGAVGPHYDGARSHVLVDHHRTTDPSGYDIALWDADCSTTCEMVTEVAAHPAFDVALDRSLAEQLYAGIIFDTGTFRYSNTSPRTLRIAASLLELGIDAQGIIERVFLDTSAADFLLRGRVLSSMQRSECGRVAYATVPRGLFEEMGASDEATEGLVSNLVFIEGVLASALFIEQPGQVRVSLRSRGQIDVSTVARYLSDLGGGHDRAAGATLEGALDAVVSRVVGRLLDGLPDA